MYQGFGKGDGGIVGGTNDDDDEAVDFTDVYESASAEESMMCSGVDENGNDYDFMVSARLCPQSGRVIWVREESESAIMQRTVGMSQMTSMLHDKDRNDVYELALQLSIKHFQEEHHRDPIVLDIGTGTGLLSMFAARHGAKFVLGCEMFTAMASIAKEVIANNFLAKNIEVIPQKSTSIECLSLEPEFPIVPDILVSELLDSALLGESCIYSHADAISRFMNTGDKKGDKIRRKYSVLNVTKVLSIVANLSYFVVSSFCVYFYFYSHFNFNFYVHSLFLFPFLFSFSFSLEVLLLLQVQAIIIFYHQYHRESCHTLQKSLAHL